MTYICTRKSQRWPHPRRCWHTWTQSGLYKLVASQSTQHLRRLAVLPSEHSHLGWLLSSVLWFRHTWQHSHSNHGSLFIIIGHHSAQASALGPGGPHEGAAGGAAALGVVQAGSCTVRSQYNLWPWLLVISYAELELQTYHRQCFHNHRKGPYQVLLLVESA